jgi:16S rRNA (adenine1518-N6/adenine1519-N6)-dimethyltransferase
VSKHRARKRFGQHFLVDTGVIDAILRAVSPGRDDTIIEIGPGQGALTAPLVRTGCTLHLVELDRDLVAELKARYADSTTVTVHEADALRFDFAALGKGLRIVGNLPYNISTPLLFHLLEQHEAIADMHFMLQKEVVDRIAASPGSKTYGRLSVMLQASLEAEALFDIGPSAFDPPPAVDSAVVRLYPKSRSAPRPSNPATFRALVAAGFAQRRKTLRNALREHVDMATLTAAGIDPGARAETIAVEDWIRLADVVTNMD